MGAELSWAVQAFVDEVRQNPATAVAPERLRELERRAREDLDGSRIATTAPVADRTLLSRVLLTAANSGTVNDDFPDLGESMRIVGFNPTIVALESGKTLPPLAAIDVRISLGRNKKEIYTEALNLPQKAGSTGPMVAQSEFVPLSSIDAAIANRLMDFHLDESPYAVTFDYQWAVDAATRTALNWSN